MKHWNPRAENDPVDRTKEVKAYESDLANLLKANTSSHAEIVAIAAADVVAQADYFETFFTFGTGLTYSTEIGLVRLGHPLQQLVEDIASRITDLEAWDRRHGEALRLKVQRFEAKAKIAAAHMERDGLGFRLIRVAPSPHGLLGGVDKRQVAVTYEALDSDLKTTVRDLLPQDDVGLAALLDDVRRHIEENTAAKAKLP